MKILSKIKWAFRWLFGIKSTPKETKTPVTRDEILDYADEISSIKNSVRKSHNRKAEEFAAEQMANRKKVSKKKAQKQARKKNRK